MDFVNYTSTTFDLVDHTDAGTTFQKSQLLNGGANGRVGLAKSFSVMAGDEITASAWVKYMNLSATTNATPLINNLASVFGVSSSSTGDQLKLYNGLNAFAGTVPGGDHPGDDETPPKLFITVLFFDKSYNLVDAAWDQVTTDGAQTSSTVKDPPHDLLSKAVKAPASGYAYVFISNENPTYVDAYFDDVSIAVTPTPVIASDDYYPFGLTFNSYSRENSVKQDYEYNGKELQDELNLGWMDYGARMYMADIGRWGVVDPKAEMYFQFTPYTYAANTPTNAIDPDGNLVIFINGNHFGSGGTRDYWSTPASNMPNSPNASSYNMYRFVDAVMNRLEDHHALYVDGGGNKIKGFHPLLTLLSPGFSGVSPKDRQGAGYDEGMANAAAIIESLHRTGCVIDESLKVITHSMGSAYGKGYAQAILDYAKLHKIAGVTIAFEADFAPFQPSQQKAIKGVPTFQFSHDSDMVAGDNQMPGAKKMDTSSDTQQGHSISGFADQIRNLPAGKYKIINGKIVPE